jgi:hypothetical protein
MRLIRHVGGNFAAFGGALDKQQPDKIRGAKGAWGRIHFPAEADYENGDKAHLSCMREMELFKKRFASMRLIAFDF